MIHGLDQVHMFYTMCDLVHRYEVLVEQDGFNEALTYPKGCNAGWYLYTCNTTNS